MPKKEKENKKHPLKEDIAHSLELVSAVTNEEIKAEFQKKYEEEVLNDVRGTVGRRDLDFVAPRPLIYTSRTSDQDALAHDNALQNLINESLKEVESIRSEMEREKSDIDRLRNETRMIIASLLVA